MKTKIIVSILTILLAYISLNSKLNAQTIPYSNGRIIISCDGNEHDHADNPNTKWETHSGWTWREIEKTSPDDARILMENPVIRK